MYGKSLVDLIDYLSVCGNSYKLVSHYSVSSCQPIINLIVFQNGHLFSGLWKTIRLDLTLPVTSEYSKLVALEAHLSPLHKTHLVKYNKKRTLETLNLRCG